MNAQLNFQVDADNSSDQVTFLTADTDQDGVQFTLLDSRGYVSLFLIDHNQKYVLFHEVFTDSAEAREYAEIAYSEYRSVSTTLDS